MIVRRLLGSRFWVLPALPLLHLADRHRLKQRKAEQIAIRLLNAMMERARSMAERQTINDNHAENPTSQIRPALPNS